jgi:hypothetical protein
MQNSPREVLMYSHSIWKIVILHYHHVQKIYILTPKALWWRKMAFAVLGRFL